MVHLSNGAATELSHFSYAKTVRGAEAAALCPPQRAAAAASKGHPHLGYTAL
jgi:hypothetical protein